MYFFNENSIQIVFVSKSMVLFIHLYFSFFWWYDWKNNKIKILWVIKYLLKLILFLNMFADECFLRIYLYTSGSFHSLILGLNHIHNPFHQSHLHKIKSLRFFSFKLDLNNFERILKKKKLKKGSGRNGVSKPHCMRKPAL